MPASRNLDRSLGWRRGASALALLAIATACLLAGSLRPARAAEGADPWQADLDRFAEQDRRSPPPADPILFVGSSTIRLYNLAKWFPDLPVINRGFGGSQVADVARNVDRLVLDYKPHIVVFYSGDNDIASGKSPEQVATDFAGLYKRVRAELPKTRILFLPTKPSVQRWALVEKQRDANARIKALGADDPLFVYVDTSPVLLGPDGKPRAELFQSDGLHLNDRGYELWTGIVKPLLVEK